jgi:undecaprenyl-diphosphatase
MTSVAHSEIASRPSHGRGLVLCNPDSGPDDTSLRDLRATFPDHDVDICPPDHLAERVQQAVRQGRPFVGIAGGDGSIRTVAQALAHSETRLLPIPAGTHNHFAHALGIDTLEDAAKAAAAETERVIDLGRVNGAAFVNTSSIGFYPRIVEQREHDRRAIPKPLADARATWRALRKARTVNLRLDGRPATAWLVFVGNGCYGERFTDLATRERLDENLIDVRVVRAERRFARTRLLLATALGRLAHSPILERRTCREIVIALRGKRAVEVALDGDILRLAAPLRYSSDAGALRVLVPR